MSANAKLAIQFYNTFFGNWPSTDGATCRDKCTFRFGPEQHLSADAVVFHLPTLQHLEFIDKAPGQIWVAWCMESVVTCPALADPIRMSRFDVMMDYRRSADVWVPYFDPGMRDGMLRPPPKKLESSPVVHFQSNPYDRSGRNQFAKELMRYVKIDSFGSVMQTKHREDHDRAGGTPVSIIADYKFVLALENSICPDYVSDKFFHGLISGTVPVYFGTETVKDLAPSPQCYIDARDFETPRALAEHLNFLDQDDEAYAKCFDWKKQGLSQQFEQNCDRIRAPLFDRLYDAVRDALESRR